jgi:peptide/nickel transport system permease protein
MALGVMTPDEVIQKVRIEMHFDEPIYIQYLYWIKGITHGDFGISLYSRQPVIKDIIEVLPATLELAIYTVLLQVFFGILIGDYLSRLLAYMGVVTPPFIFAILGMFIFSYKLDILPTMGRLTPGMMFPTKITGLITIDSLIQGKYFIFFDALKHLILPAISLALVGIANTSRIVRSGILDNINKDYILAAKSYGIPDHTIMFQDLLKPSIIPAVSITGLQFAVIMTNALLVEAIFNWPGFARYGMNAILEKDLNAITAVVVVFGFIILVTNVFVDIIINYLDPRISMREDVAK